MSVSQSWSAHQGKEETCLYRWHQKVDWSRLNSSWPKWCKECLSLRWHIGWLIDGVKNTFIVAHSIHIYYWLGKNLPRTKQQICYSSLFPLWGLACIMPYFSTACIHVTLCAERTSGEMWCVFICWVTAYFITYSVIWKCWAVCCQLSASDTNLLSSDGSYVVEAYHWPVSLAWNRLR